MNAIKKTDTPLGATKEAGNEIHINAKNTTYHIYSQNLRNFFSSLAAEKSGCIKYAGFLAFRPRNALLSCFAFFNNFFVSSNNTRIPEFQILFVLHGS
jgi:hypothetical protein